MSKPVRIYLMAIKPKYAEMIYAGEKRFELRKMPPPCNTWIYLYESAPVSAVTGKVYIGMQVRGDSAISGNLPNSSTIAATSLALPRNSTKITLASRTIVRLQCFSLLNVLINPVRFRKAFGLRRIGDVTT